VSFIHYNIKRAVSKSDISDPSIFQKVATSKTKRPLTNSNWNATVPPVHSSLGRELIKWEGERDVGRRISKTYLL